MANLKEIRNRISSVSSTMQITSAMKMVSAAKLKKAQDAITAMRPYSNKLTEILQSLSSSIDSDNKYAQKRDVKKVLIVSITSNRGLCGGFNSNIFKKSTELANSIYNDSDVSFVAIGKKGNDFLQKSFNVESNHIDIFDNLNMENVSLIAESLMEMFINEDFDKRNFISSLEESERKRFNVNGLYDWEDIIVKNEIKKISAWDAYWYQAVFLNNGFSLYPNRSHTQNEGFDGTGMHCSNISDWKTPLNNGKTKNFPDKIQISRLFNFNTVIFYKIYNYRRYYRYHKDKFSSVENFMKFLKRKL